MSRSLFTIKLTFAKALALVGFCICSIQGFAQNSYHNLTLPQAVSIAMENNLALKGAMLDERISRENTNEIRSQGLPQINAFGRFENYLQIPTMVFVAENPMTGEEVQNVIRAGRPYNLTGGIEASQLLYSQTYMVGLKAAKSAQQLSALQTQQVKEGVIYDLSMSYYGAQISAKQLDIARNNLEKINRLIQVTEVQQKNGLVKKSDLSKLKVNRTNLETQIQNLQTLNQQQANVLKFFMGLPIDADVSVNTEVSPVAASLQEEAPANRTELLLLNKQKELYRLEQKNIQAGYMPSLALFGRHSQQAMRDQIDFFDRNKPWFPNSIVGLTLNVPIFDGLQKRAQMQKSKLNLEKTLNSEEQFRQQVDMEMFNAKAQLSNSHRALAAQEENKQLAEEIYAQTQLEYKEGMATMADLLNAETSMKEAQTNYINALIQTLIASLDVKKAAGNLLETTQK
jgi:outer membrane protein